MLGNTEHIRSNRFSAQPGEIMVFWKIGVFSDNAISLLSLVTIPWFYVVSLIWSLQNN